MSIVTCADPNNERKAISALVVDRVPVMGGRVVVALDGRDLPVSLLSPSARDHRLHVFTLALGARKNGSKKLRLRASSEREYRQWTSAIASAMQTKAVDSKHVEAKNENENGQVGVAQLDTSLRLSQCETVATSSSASMTSRNSCCSRTSLTSLSTDEEVAEDEEEDVVVSGEVDDATSTKNSTIVERVASAVASCEASESWRGSSARQQLACNAIREISRVSQWNAPAVIDAMRLEAKRDVLADHHQQRQQQQQDVDADAVCEKLSTALDASVYIMTTPSNLLESSASTAASTPALTSTASTPNAFYAYDAKQGVLRSCSAVEWISALTGEPVTARRCPVILRARGLDLAGCSLMRFADVILASPSVDDEVADDDAEDDDSEGVWV